MCIDLVLVVFISGALVGLSTSLIYNVLEIKKLKNKVKDLSEATIDMDIYRELVKSKFDSLNEKVNDFHVKLVNVYSTIEEYKEYIGKRFINIHTSLKANQEDIVTLGEACKGYKERSDLMEVTLTSVCNDQLKDLANVLELQKKVSKVHDWMETKTKTAKKAKSK